MRHTHFGEGNYDETEQVIQELLAEAGQAWQAPALGRPSPARCPGTRPRRPTSGWTARAISLRRSAGRRPTAALQRAGPPAGQPFARRRLVDARTASTPGRSSRRDTAAALRGQGRLPGAGQDTPATVDGYRCLRRQATNRSEDVDARGRLHVGGAGSITLPGYRPQESTIDLHFDQTGVRVYAFTFGS